MVTGRIFPFVYHTARRRGRKLEPFRMRDIEALQFLMDALKDRGYRRGDTIFNYPMHLAGRSKRAVEEFDYSGLRENDIIVLPTRPPMDDHELCPRVRSGRSGTELESRLFDGPLRTWFEICARPEMRLTEKALRVSSEVAKRHVTTYRQNGAATYQSIGSPITGQVEELKGPHRRTAAFLVCERAWPGGPAFLAAFGMAGTETLVWCYQLATRFDHLLCSAPFVMAEMRTVPCACPPSMAFADSWEVTILGAAEPVPSRDPKRAA